MGHKLVRLYSFDVDVDADVDDVDIDKFKFCCSVPRKQVFGSVRCSDKLIHAASDKNSFW